MTNSSERIQRLIETWLARIPKTLAGNEGKEFVTAFYTACGRDQAEATYSELGEFGHTGPTLEEFSDFILQRGMVVLKAIEANHDHLGIERAPWVIRAENAAAAAYTSRLDELFEASVGQEARHDQRH